MTKKETKGPVKETIGADVVKELQEINDILAGDLEAKDKEIKELKKKLKEPAKTKVNAKTFGSLLEDIREYLCGRDRALKNEQSRKHLGRVFTLLTAAETEFNIYREKENKK